MTTIENKTIPFSAVINVPITDFILTPVACGVLINEVMKNLLYQRSQIPYPYTWLKNIVNKKRRSLEETVQDTQKSFTVNKHYKVVSTAYDTLENVMSNILKVFAHYGDKLKEVVFVIGVTPVCAKEIFTVKISHLAKGHVERNHASEHSKKHSRILRGIFLENDWMNLIEKPMSCSNTYIFLKLSGVKNRAHGCDESIFIPSKPLSFLPKTKHTVINLNYLENDQFSCCGNIEVFQDSDVNSPEKMLRVIVAEESGQCEDVWLQSKILIQGFKDCFINKISACELW